MRACSMSTWIAGMTRFWAKPGCTALSLTCCTVRGGLGRWRGDVGLFGRGCARFVGRVAVRASRLADRREALPPGVEGEPVGVVVFIAGGAGLAHFNVIDGMNLPKRGARRAAIGAARADRVRSVEEKLPGDAVRKRFEARVHGGVGRIFFGDAVPHFVVPDLIPGRGAIVGADFGGDAITFLSIRLRAEGDVNVV